MLLYLIVISRRIASFLIGPVADFSEFLFPCREDLVVENPNRKKLEGCLLTTIMIVVLCIIALLLFVMIRLQPEGKYRARYSSITEASQVFFYTKFVSAYLTIQKERYTKGICYLCSKYCCMSFTPINVKYGSLMRLIRHMRKTYVETSNVSERRGYTKFHFVL